MKNRKKKECTKLTNFQRTTGHIQMYQSMHNGSWEGEKGGAERTLEQIMTEKFQIWWRILIHISEELNQLQTG